MLPLQGAWVWSLVGELRSHMPHGKKKKKKSHLKVSIVVNIQWDYLFAHLTNIVFIWWFSLLIFNLIIVICSVAKSCPTLVTPWSVAHQVPLSMGFPRQEYCSGLSFPSLGNYCYCCCVVQLLSHVWLFETPWTAAHQASLTFTISWSLLKFMSIESVMLSNHPLPPPFSFIFQPFPTSWSFPMSQLFTSGG